jgi:hypothetical protein
MAGKTDAKSKHRLEVITEGFIEFVNSWLVFDREEGCRFPTTRALLVL